MRVSSKSVPSRRRVGAYGGPSFLLAAALLIVPATTRAAGDVEEKGADGKVTVRYRTDAAGRKSGPYEELFPDGKPRVKGAYTAGMKTGAWLTRDEKGLTVESATYRAGKLEGPFVRYFPGSSRAMMKASYKADTFAGPVMVYAESGKTLRQVVYPRPRTAVEKAWATLAVPSPKPAVFKEEPAVQPPYKAGALVPETIEEAVRVTKLYRFLSGLPFENVKADAKFNDLAQHGSVVLAKLGMLTHTPDKPADMDEDFFKLAYAGCNQSNIFSSSGSSTVVDAVHGFMDDSDDGNVKKVGHRVWILTPSLEKIGFGKAKGYTAMHVVGGGSAKSPDYNYFAFPGEGYYPQKLIHKHYAWSLHLNTSKVKVGAGVKIKVLRLDDYFQQTAETEAEVVTAPPGGDGGMAVVIFKPKLAAIEMGRYWVQVDGLQNPKGQDVPFGYLVEFIDPTATEAAPPKDATAAKE